MKYFIILCFSFFHIQLVAQVYRIGDDLYSINKKDLQTLENYSRRYFQCSTSVDSIEANLEIISETNKAKDTILISQQRSIYLLHENITKLQSDISILTLKNNNLANTITDLQLHNKKLKKRNYYAYTIAISVGLVSALILTN